MIIIIHKAHPYEGNVANDIRNLVPEELVKYIGKSRGVDYKHLFPYEPFKLKIEVLSDVKVGGEFVSSGVGFQELIKSGYHRVSYESLHPLQKEQIKSLYEDGLVSWIAIDRNIERVYKLPKDE